MKDLLTGNTDVGCRFRKTQTGCRSFNQRSLPSIPTRGLASTPFQDFHSLVSIDEKTNSCKNGQQIYPFGCASLLLLVRCWFVTYCSLLRIGNSHWWSQSLLQFEEQPDEDSQCCDGRGGWRQGSLLPPFAPCLWLLLFLIPARSGVPTSLWLMSLGSLNMPVNVRFLSRHNTDFWS